MVRALLAALAIACAAPAGASAAEMQPPRLSIATIDWTAAAASLGDKTDATPAALFASRNAPAAARFPGIAKSAVPVLLPFDLDGLRAALAAAPAQTAADIADRFIKGGFHASKFFLAGPGGYDAAFTLTLADVPEFSDIAYRKPVRVLLSGFAATYDLGGPPLPAGEPVKQLDDVFPGIRRILHESYVRYVFERYGATYVAAVPCRDMHPRRRILSCRQADRIAERFLRVLTLVGGSPQAPGPAVPTLAARPASVSPDFTYFSPGFLIPGTGLTKDIGGRDDDTVYAALRFPLKAAPDFANSQSFNNWGDCDFTGRTVRRLRAKDTVYACKVNGIPLEFDEAAPGNYSYPWRDNFCEHRHFFVGQCPGGQGHQGQDIRPSSCTLRNAGADRCEPYQHDVVAAADGMILRAPKDEAVMLFTDSADAHLRLRYIHMSPKRLDTDGVLSGRTVQAGERIGQVGNYNDYERGTTYHLHFDLQVPTKAGWVFVSPYMTLVAAYERLIGARGTEIAPGDAVPPVAGVPPVIEHTEPGSSALAVPTPPEKPEIGPVTGRMTEENAATRAKPRAAEKHERPRRHHRHHRHRHRRHDADGPASD